MNKIKKLSRFLKYVFYALLVIFPIFIIIPWLGPMKHLTQMGFSFSAGFGSAAGSYITDEVLKQLSWNGRIIGFLITLIPHLLAIASIYCLARLFSLYEQGKIFVIDSCRYLKKVGFLFLVGEFSSIFIFNPFLCLFASIIDPNKKPNISVMVGSNDLYNIFIALLVILVSWIMTEACKINEEQEMVI